jgi:hypothetical protein
MSISLDVMVENKLRLWDFGHADAVSIGGFVFDEGLLSARSPLASACCPPATASSTRSRASMSGKVAGNVVNEEDGSIQGAHGSR